MFILFFWVLLILAAACGGVYAGQKLPDMNTEAGIREYMAGEWHFLNTSDLDYYSCRMIIGKDMKVEFEFSDGKKVKERVTGQFYFNRIRIYAGVNEAPDVLHLELTNYKWKDGGDFFFLHRTVYDKRRVMSLFSAGNGGCLFDDSLVPPVKDGWRGCPNEMVFVRETGEEYELAPRANAEFYAVYWGRSNSHPKNAVWLDDIKWPPPGPYDIEEIGSDTWYLYLTTKYDNETPISVAYVIADGTKTEGDLRQGEVYLVKTNGRGEIIKMQKANAPSGN